MNTKCADQTGMQAHMCTHKPIHASWDRELEGGQTNKSLTTETNIRIANTAQGTSQDICQSLGTHSYRDNYGPLNACE